MVGQSGSACSAEGRENGVGAAGPPGALCVGAPAKRENGKKEGQTGRTQGTFWVQISTPPFVPALDFRSLSTKWESRKSLTRRTGGQDEVWDP